ncbi:hypothetical protein MM236_13635 [Belliella sp. DSM 107340]|uniref:Uncharacterized protein n=1 Tax=Belliella calami TaxID=2923436 RepID=A0ABS9UQZ3_9BACT|nr:hypothetical protein [Belliella calami]MCH7399041.1 hypothetical protein [Belliella calami]
MRLHPRENYPDKNAEGQRFSVEQMAHAETQERIRFFIVGKLCDGIDFFGLAVVLKDV